MIYGSFRARRTTCHEISDTSTTIVRDSRVCDAKVGYTRRRLNENAVTARSCPAVNEIPQDAIADDQAAAGAEHDAIVGGSGAVDLQAGEDDVARTGI